MGAFFESLMAGERDAILVAAAVYSAAMGAYSIWFCFALRRWPSTVATLSRSGLSRFGWSSTASDQDYSADVSYSYVVDGETYEGHRLSPAIIIASANARFLLRWQLRGVTKVGEDRVKVFYKPTNPKKSYLIVPSWRTIGLVALITFGCALLLLGAR